MADPVRGDFVKLEQKIKELRSVAGGKVRARIHRQLAATAMTQVALGFRLSRDPYGNAWKPVGRRKRDKDDSPGKPLIDTSRMRNAFNGRVTSDGFVIGSNTVYMPTHQYGRGNITARPMLPVTAKGLGLWEAPLKRSLARVMNKIFGK